MGLENWITVCQWSMYLLHTIAMAFAAVNLLQFKGKSRIKGCIGLATVVLIFSVFSRWIMSYTKNVLLNTLMCTFFITISVIVAFKDSLMKKISGALAVMLTMVVVEFFTAFFTINTVKKAGVVLKYSYQSINGAPEYVLLAGIYSSILCFVCFMFLIVVWKAIVEHFWIKEYLLYIIIPLYQFSILLAYYSSTQKLGAY